MSPRRRGRQHPRRPDRGGCCAAAAHRNSCGEAFPITGGAPWRRPLERARPGARAPSRSVSGSRGRGVSHVSALWREGPVPAGERSCGPMKRTSARQRVGGEARREKRRFDGVFETPRSARSRDEREGAARGTCLRIRAGRGVQWRDPRLETLYRQAWISPKWCGASMTLRAIPEACQGNGDNVLLARCFGRHRCPAPWCRQR